MTRIVLVEDHAMVRKGFEEVVRLNQAHNIIGSFESAEQMLDSNVLEQADLLISDINMAGLDGIALAAKVKAQFPNLKLIILSMHEEPYYVWTAKKINVDGFVSKRFVSEQLLTAIDSVMNGVSFFDDIMSTQTDQDKHMWDMYQSLSNREKEVFILLSQGKEIKRVANELSISIKTVHAHKKSIIDKLALRNDFDITKRAIRLGLISPSDF